MSDRLIRDFGSRRKRRNFLLASLLFGAVVLDAQTPGTPTFRSSVNYVDVDVTVTDAQGRFVGDLSRDDFEVLEDGKPQRIDTFSLVELPVEHLSQQNATFGGRRIAADVRSNRDVESGRVYVIVLDDLDVTPLRSARVIKSAREFVEQHLGPHDLAAVVSTSGRTEVAQGFTSDPVLLLAAIDQFVGQRLEDAEVGRIDAYYEAQALSGLDQVRDPNNDPQQQTVVPNLITQIDSAFDRNELERGHRAVGVIRTLKNLAEFLGAVRGRRKALLFFSEGIDYPMAEVESSHSGNEILSATQDAMNAAALANVNIFALDPRGMIAMPTDLIDRMTTAGAPDYAGNAPDKLQGTPMSGLQALMDEIRLTQDTLKTLAEGTGGFAAIDTNAFGTAFDRIVEANSHYYLLGYTPPTHPRDGRFHNIEVRLKRPGLKATARKGYPSPSGKTPEERRQEEVERRAREKAKGGAPDTSSELLGALNMPVQQPGFTFDVQAVPLKGASPKEASLAVTIELDGSQLQFAPQSNSLLADTLEVSFFAIKDDGKPLRGTRSALNLSVKPETYQRMKTLGIRLNTRTTLAPGRYQLRIGARDPMSGKAGTVFNDVVVPDFTRNGVMVSGLLIASAEASTAMTVQHDTAVEAVLGAPVTSRRSFSSGDTLRVMAEIYDNRAADEAQPIPVALQLLDEQGKTIYSSRDSLASSGIATKNGKTLSYAKEISLKDAPAGRYLLRLEATDRGAKTPAAAETIITIK